MTIIKTALKNTKGIYIKLGLVLALLLLGVVSYQLATVKPKQSSPSVLGQETGDAGKIVNSAENIIQDAQKNIYGAAQQTATAIGNTATQSAQTVKEYIVNTTVSNAVKQLDGLPSDVKDKLKEYICK